MQVEFQLKKEKFQSIVSHQISSNYPCVSMEFKRLNETFLVDRVEYLDLTIIRSENKEPMVLNTPIGLTNSNGFILELHQIVKIYVVSLSDLKSNNTDESNPIITIEITLIFDMKFVLKASDNHLHLVISYSRTLLPDNLDILTAQDIQNIHNYIDAAMHDFEIEPGGLLTSFLGPNQTLSNAGILMDNKGELISIRLEINGPYDNSLQCWNQFYNGESIGSCKIKNLLSGNDWAELIDKEIVVPPTVNQFSEGINKAQQEDVFSLDKGPDGSWIPSPPTINVDFSGELIDLCWAVYFFYATEIDVDTDFETESIFSVPSDNVLQINIKISWDFNDAEIFECAVTAAALWPTVGAFMSPIILGEGQMTLGEMLLANILGPIGVFAIFCTKAGSFYTPDDTATGSVQPVDDTDADLEYKVTTNQVYPEGMTLKAVVGDPKGMVLAGSIMNFPKIDPPYLEDVLVDSFGWGFGCGDNSVRTTASIKLYNKQASASSDRRIPINICQKPRAIDDPLNQFASKFIETSDNGDTITISISDADLLPEYLQNPYPCKILVKTNGGARLITIEPIKELSNAERLSIIITGEFNCRFYAAIDKWIYLTPDWLIDPPPEKIVEHLWQIVTVGLKQDVKLRLKNTKGEEVATINGSAHPAITQIDFVSLPAIKKTELTIQKDLFSEKSPKALLGHEPDYGKIMINQVLLIKESNLVSNMDVFHITSALRYGRKTVFCITSSGLNVFDIENPNAPRLIRQYYSKQLRGSVVVEDSLIIWGKGELLAISFKNYGMDLVPIKLSSERTNLANVYAISKYRNYLYAITDQYLHILDNKFRHIDQLVMKDFKHMTLVGKNLVLGKQDQLLILSLASPEKPIYSGSYSYEVESLATSKLIGDRKSIYIKNRNNSWQVVDLTFSDNPIERARLKYKPWFVDTTRIGNILVSLEGSSNIKFYRIIEKYKIPANKLRMKVTK